MKVTLFKTYAAAIGGTLTALTTMWATAEVAVSDGVIGIDEVGSVTAAVLLLVSTVATVWAAPYQVDQH